MGRRDRAFLRAALADLRALDRRELRGREAREHDGRRLIRLRSSSCGATSPLNASSAIAGAPSDHEESVGSVAAELLDEAVFPVEIGLHRALLDVGTLIGTAIAV